MVFFRVYWNLFYILWRRLMEAYSTAQSGIGSACFFISRKCVILSTSRLSAAFWYDSPSSLTCLAALSRTCAGDRTDRFVFRTYFVGISATCKFLFNSVMEMVEKMKLNLLQEFSLAYFILFRVAILLFQLKHSQLDRIPTVYITHYDH